MPVTDSSTRHLTVVGAPHVAERRCEVGRDLEPCVLPRTVNHTTIPSDMGLEGWWLRDDC